MIKINKRSQITIFIIIAILLVAAILLFFFMLRQRNIEIQNQLNPVNYIDKCVKDNVEQAENIMLTQAGYINPEKYILFNSNKVAYLCYNKNYYQACVNQEPVYIENLQQEIKNYIKPKIEECFYSLQQELQKRNYQIGQGALSLNVEAVPNLIKVKVEKKFETTLNEETRKYDEFNIRKSSSLFELANVAREIANQEAEYCNFEYVGYMLFYPRFNIDKKSVGQAETASKIYIIGDRATGKRLYIAIRSCAIPPGF